MNIALMTYILLNNVKSRKFCNNNYKIEKISEELKNKIKEDVKNYPYTSCNEISNRIGVKNSTVNGVLTSLYKQGKISRTNDKKYF